MALHLPLLLGPRQHVEPSGRVRKTKLVLTITVASLLLACFILWLLQPLTRFSLLSNSHLTRAEYIAQFNYGNELYWSRTSRGTPVTPNPNSQWGFWEGWGTSLCWWAKVFGQRKDLADLWFTLDTIRLQTNTGTHVLPGLGMNIARYNAGAFAWRTYEGAKVQVSPNIPPYRRMHGFWEDWGSSDPTSSSWVWDVDANQISMLQKALARGADTFELFSNSPMWWMLQDHNPSGSPHGADDNLQMWNHWKHATYLATLAQHALQHWGVRFASIEAFNEPISNWWKADNNQEGCHFNRPTQADVVANLHQVIKQQGLDAIVAASDENTYDQALDTWQAFSDTTRGLIGQVNVHGYQQGSGRRDLLYNAVAGKRLWNSEYGDQDGSGMSLAKNLNLDLQWLHNTAWVYWQVLDSGGWGLIESNPGDTWIGNPNPKYFVMLHYTRHIRPGMQIIDSGDSDTVAAYDMSLHKLVLITTNFAVARWIDYDLSKFTRVAGPVLRWCTNTAGGDSYKEYHDTFLHGPHKQRRFWSWFAGKTMQTFEVEGVNI